MWASHCKRQNVNGSKNFLRIAGLGFASWFLAVVSLIYFKHTLLTIGLVTATSLYCASMVAFAVHANRKYIEIEQKEKLEKFGANTWFVESLYKQYQENPSLVNVSFIKFSVKGNGVGHDGCAPAPLVPPLP